MHNLVKNPKNSICIIIMFNWIFQPKFYEKCMLEGEWSGVLKESKSLPLWGDN